MRRLFPAFALLLGLVAAPAAARSQALKECTIGKQVTDKENKTGVITKSDGTGCTVHFPDGSEHYYIFWMLRPAGAPLMDPKEIAAIVPGRYACFAGPPMHYIDMDIVVKSSSAYADTYGKTGTYSYDPKTQIITFLSGTFMGNYAKYRGKEGIGIAPKSTTLFTTVCDLQK